MSTFFWSWNIKNSRNICVTMCMCILAQKLICLSLFQHICVSLCTVALILKRCAARFATKWTSLERLGRPVARVMAVFVFHQNPIEADGPTELTQMRPMGGMGRWHGPVASERTSLRFSRLYREKRPAIPPVYGCGWCIPKILLNGHPWGKLYCI